MAGLCLELTIAPAQLPWLSQVSKASSGLQAIFVALIGILRLRLWCCRVLCADQVRNVFTLMMISSSLRMEDSIISGSGDAKPAAREEKPPQTSFRTQNFEYPSFETHSDD